MADDDELESRLSEFRNRYRGGEQPEDEPEETPPDPGPEPGEEPAGEPEDAVEPAPEEPGASSPEPVARSRPVPGWVWVTLGCSFLIVLTGFALGFGVWGGYQIVRREVLEPSSNGVDLAREMIHFDMPPDARSLASIDLIYRVAIVGTPQEPPHGLLAVGFFPAGWSGDPEETFRDRLDRHFARGRITVNDTRGDTAPLCGRDRPYERRAGALRDGGDTRPVIQYQTCFRRDGSTLCVHTQGLGEEAERRARTLFDSLTCP